ncbi:protein tyrosine kinase [Capsaspora owczarzaki ATCC 30864]|uniref:protein tyrosine kinase n=1 Tax=Capsaspora owczarzaki (strain ATCC 30864) TaxID=595528 RepID=UPI0001FE49F6|nr:protein tyrosine kinase [Capsaspora owczarzaki ATCC 30864]|eukprot:XP_004364708.1 protein tyrosine kinase [Capsaspora owczarzaki ATCC 30864]
MRNTWRFAGPLLLLLLLLGLTPTATLAQETCDEACTCSANIATCSQIPSSLPVIIDSLILVAISGALGSGDMNHLSTLPLTSLQLSNTALTTIASDAFSDFFIETLVITNNPNLLTFESGVFNGLSTLTTLTISNIGVGLTDLSMVEFSTIPNLETLFVTNTRITQMPYSLLQDLPQLKSLSFRDSPMVAFPPAPTPDNPSALEQIDMSNTAITSIPANVYPASSVPNLRQLLVQHCGLLTSISADAFQLPSSIKLLEVSYSSLTAVSASAFYGLADLTILSLFQNEITSLDAAAFYGLSQLTHLNLGNNGDLTSLPNGLFSPLVALRELHIYGGGSQPGGGLTVIPDGAFNALGALTVLQLYSNSILGLPAHIFDYATNLQTLRLDQNDLEAFPQGFFDYAVNLRSLDVSGNAITTLSADVFNQLSSMTTLKLNGNNLTELPPQIFSALTSLTTLNLQGNQFTTLPPGLFMGLSGSLTVNLDDNDFNVGVDGAPPSTYIDGGGNVYDTECFSCNDGYDWHTLDVGGYCVSGAAINASEATSASMISATAASEASALATSLASIEASVIAASLDALNGKGGDSDVLPIAVGAAVGGVAFIVLILVLVLVLRRRSSRSRQSIAPILPTAAKNTQDAKSSKNDIPLRSVSSAYIYSNGDPIYSSVGQDGGVYSNPAQAKAPQLDNQYDNQAHAPSPYAHYDNSNQGGNKPSSTTTTAAAPTSQTSPANQYDTLEVNVIAPLAAKSPIPVIPTEEAEETAAPEAGSGTTLRVYEHPGPAATALRKGLILGSTLGSGEFGVVMRGSLAVELVPRDAQYLIRDRTRQQLDVAVKLLKDGASEKARKEFVEEARMVMQFNSRFVVRAIGAVMESDPFMCILERVPFGDLRDVLQKSAHASMHWSHAEFAHTLQQVASGLEYLESIRFVHRDVAARNCLVGAELTVKISDFGLSRVLAEEQDYYHMETRGRLPAKWMAPESLSFRKFTHQSDVWSFAVLAWEAYSYGASPFSQLQARDVLAHLEAGQRLERPAACPEDMYQHLLRCWSITPADRPKFTELKGIFAAGAAGHSIRDIGGLLM